MDIYFLNRWVKDLINQKHIPASQKRELLEVLNSDFPKRLRSDSLKNLAHILPELKEIDLLQFEELKDEIGLTYGLFVSRGDFSEGICTLIKVELDNDIRRTQPQLFGSAKTYEKHYQRYFDYLKKFIQEHLENAYFFSGIFDRLNFKILNPLKLLENDLNLKGISLDLPLLIAIFSVLINKPIPAHIASTGKINDELKINHVDGLPQKVDALINEYPEVKELVVPKDCENEVRDLSGLKFHFVSKLEEAIEIFFPNFKELINRENFLGKISIDFDVVETDKDLNAVKLSFNYDYNSVYTLQPEILNYFNLSKKIEDYRKEGITCFLLYNFRPLWLPAGLMDAFVNKVSLVALYDTNLSAYVVVYSRNEIKKGEIIRIKN